MARNIWYDKDIIYILGENNVELGCSAFDEYIQKTGISEPPTINLKLEKKLGDFILDRIENGLIRTCHDISEGGILIALAELALNSKIGALIKVPDNIPGEWWFSEAQARYIVTIPKKQKIMLEKQAEIENIPLLNAGIVKGNTLQISKEMSISLSELKKYHESWLPNYINS